MTAHALLTRAPSVALLNISGAFLIMGFALLMQLITLPVELDASFNKAYDKEIYRRMWGELRLNYWIQIAMRNPRICNFIVKYAIGNKFIQDLVLSGFNANQFKPKFLKAN